MALRNLQSLEKTGACAALYPYSIGAVPVLGVQLEKLLPVQYLSKEIVEILT